MHHRVVGGVERLSVERVREYRDRAVMFVADDLPVAMLAGNLAALPVKGVAVAVAGRSPERADVAILLQPA